MSFVRQNAFIVAFLLLLAVLFVTDSRVWWPFLAYDMYARRDIPSLRFAGVKAGGGEIVIDAPKFFRYYPGTFFSMGLTQILRERPEQFALVARTLRERYNRAGGEPILAVRAWLSVEGVETPLGEFR